MDKYNQNSKRQSSAQVGSTDAKLLNFNRPEFSSGDLGKIQEILFGQQLRNNTDQLSSLSSHVEQRLNGLSDMCQRQFTELSTKLDTSIDSLKNSQSERDKEFRAQLGSLSSKNTSLETTLLEKIRKSSDSAALMHQQLNGQIEKSGSTFSESLNTTRAELTNLLETAIAELQTEKLDRTALSNLLGTVATQLTNGKDLSDGTKLNSEKLTAVAPDRSGDS